MKLLFALMAALFFVGMPAWAEDCFFGCDDPVYFGVNWKTATSTDVSGVDVHAQGEGGDTPLHKAALYSQNQAVIEALLSAGADVNARDVSGDTPLHVAAGYGGGLNNAEVLVKAGANVNARDGRR